jgi:hypothetical protein
MDRISEYRQIIKDLLSRYAQFKPSHGDIEVRTIFDEDTDTYVLMYTGWDKHRRIYGNVLHFDIKDGKIWLQHNGTEQDVAQELLEAGVPRDAIVLGLLSPQSRAYTEYAVA